MDDCKVFVGLDYHQASVQVCVEDQNGEVLLNRRCPNDWRSIVRAVNGYGIVSRVAIESLSEQTRWIGIGPGRSGGCGVKTIRVPHR